MMTYTYKVNGTATNKLDAVVAWLKGQTVEVIEWSNGKYNGHYENYIPKYAR